MTKNALPSDVNFVICEGKGSRVLGTDGRWRIDYVGGAGALILGHAHTAIVAALQEQSTKGTHFFGLVKTCLRSLCVKL